MSIRLSELIHPEAGQGRTRCADQHVLFAAAGQRADCYEIEIASGAAHLEISSDESAS